MGILFGNPLLGSFMVSSMGTVHARSSMEILHGGRLLGYSTEMVYGDPLWGSSMELL